MKSTYDIAHGPDWFAVVDWEPPRAIAFAQAGVDAQAWFVDSPGDKIVIQGLSMAKTVFVALNRLRGRPEPCDCIPHLEAIALRDEGVPVTEAMAEWLRRRES